MIDQLIVGSKSSYDDFEASVKERKISAPKKKSIKETVPFSNVTYDFTAINGEIYWEERTLEYVFEITANTPEELEEKKQKFVSWVMNLMNAELHDPFIKDYHFNATFSDIDIDDSEIEKSTITVTFTAYPYMIADNVKVYRVALVASKEVTATVHNDSSHRITPTITSDVAFTLKIDNSTFSLSAGETTDDAFKLEPGVTTFKLKAESAGTIEISFFEEVF